MRRFWYFDVSVWSVDKKPYHSGLCQNSVFSPYCKDWDLIYPPKLIQAPPISMNTTQIPPDTSQTPPRHPPDIPREHEMPTDNNDAKKHCQKQHLSVSWGLWRCLLAYVGMLCSTEMLLGYRGNIWGVFGWIWVEFMEIGGAQMCLGGIWVLNPCSMEWKHYFGTALNGTFFCQLTILRHQNTKTAAYKLAENDWVRPFFAIFRFIREILFVTVAFDHPVFVHFPKQHNEPGRAEGAR